MLWEFFLLLLTVYLDNNFEITKYIGIVAIHENEIATSAINYQVYYLKAYGQLWKIYFKVYKLLKLW